MTKYGKKVVSGWEIFGVIGEYGVHLSIHESIKNFLGHSFKILQFLVGDIIDKCQKIRESAENFIVQFSSKFNQFHIDEIKSAVSRFLQLSQLRYQQRSEAFHRRESWYFIALMTFKGVFDELIIVVAWTFMGRGELLEYAFEFALDDCSSSYFLGWNGFGIGDVFSWQSIFVVIAKIGDKTHQEITFLSAGGRRWCPHGLKLSSQLIQLLFDLFHNIRQRPLDSLYQQFWQFAGQRSGS